MNHAKTIVLQDNTTSSSIAFDEIVQVSQALQAQLDHDFSTVWGRHAHVLPLPRSQKIPPGAWPIYLVDRSSAGLGVHLDKNGIPYAEVTADQQWSITASHELLEMLFDPLGNQFRQGPDIDPNAPRHLVSYLVEVADPCEIYSYKISGVSVSDFILSEYYDENADEGTPFDFLGKLSEPYSVPGGCYISWQDPLDDHWHQKTPDGQIITASRKINHNKNPRDDRDDSFGEEEEEKRNRHNLSKILTKFSGQVIAE
jgi:hypothetical protein